MSKKKAAVAVVAGDLLADIFPVLLVGGLIVAAIWYGSGKLPSVFSYLSQLLADIWKGTISLKEGLGLLWMELRNGFKALLGIGPGSASIKTGTSTGVTSAPNAPSDAVSIPSPFSGIPGIDISGGLSNLFDGLGNILGLVYPQGPKQ